MPPLGLMSEVACKCLERTSRTPFSNGFLSQRAGSDSQLGGEGRGGAVACAQDGFRVAVLRETFAHTQKCVQKVRLLPPHYQRPANGVDRKLGAGACSVDRLGVGDMLGGWTGVGRSLAQQGVLTISPGRRLWVLGKNALTLHLTHKASPGSYS